MATQGRFLPFAAFWAESLHCKTMLRCVGRESAKSGSPALDEDSAPETEFSTGSPTYNQGQNQMYRDCLS